MVKRDTSSGVKSIYTGIRLLIGLAEFRRPMSLKELSAVVGMPASKAHRYLASLLRSGVVIQDPENRTYDLGPVAMKLGLAAMGRSGIIVQAIRLASIVRDALNETAVLTVWGNRGPTVIHVENSRETIIETVRVGTVLPVVETAAGRVYAAFQPPSDVRPIIEQELASAEDVRNRGHTTRDQFEHIVEQVRLRRQSVIKEFHALGVNAVASPLMYPAGNLVAVLAVIGRSEKFVAGLDGPIARGLHKASATFPLGQQSIDAKATAFVTQ